MADLDFAGSNTVLRYVPDTRMMVASGPPRFLEVLHTFLSKVQTNTIQNFADETVVQIFPLKYAFAYDVTLDVGNGNGVSIEGVATLLTRILSGMNTIPNVMQESVLLGSPNKPSTMDGVIKQQSAANQAQQMAAQAAQKEQEAKKQSTQVSQLKGITKPSSRPLRTTDDKKTKTSVEETEARSLMGKFTSITYDARQNAVIIRDRKELMPFYQSLIERFDVPMKAVEIDVAIVDINVGRSRKMGIDVLEFLNGERSLLWRPEGGDLSLDDKNLNFYLKVPNLGGSGITARLQALESSSAAKTLSRPSVLTLDNIAAVISNNRETYVPVAGAYATDLFTVSAKVALRVIPHIIDIPRDDGTVERKIKLFVSIEDGTMSDTGGSAGMPMVSSSQINTQSILNEGQSLIVGGYYYEHHSDGRRGIPVLKNLPVVGRLFSMADRATETMERLFIISPRVVELSPNESDPYEKFFQKSNLSGKPTLNMDEFAIPKQPRRKGKIKRSQYGHRISTLQYEA
jgi:type III secretion protein C